jgi:hypothetical protein
MASAGSRSYGWSFLRRSCARGVAEGGLAEAEQHGEIEHRDRVATQVDEAGDERRREEDARDRAKDDGLLHLPDGHTQLLPGEEEADGLLGRRLRGRGWTHPAGTILYRSGAA